MNAARHTDGAGIAPAGGPGGVLPGSLASPVLLLGLLEGASLTAMGWIPGARHTPLPALGLWTVAFSAYAAACWLHARRPLSRGAVWAIALALRLALLPLVPHFSDDIYRYLWDGWVSAQGLNPYLHAPADPALADLRTAWHALINHATIPTIYPPGAQVVFRLLASVAPAVLLFKLAWVAADLGVGAVLERLTRNSRGRPSAAVLLWLWSPLVLVEVAWSGHLEPLGLLPMLAALLFLRSRESTPESPPPLAPGSDGARPGRAGGAVAGLLLGLGVSVKLAPAAALPALWRRRGVLAALFVLLPPALLYIPFLEAGSGLFAGLGEFGRRWEFSAGLFRLLEAAAGPTGGRLASGALVMAVALGAAWRRWTVERALFWTLGAALLLSPTLHPWYLLWILPLAALSGSRAWILFTGLVFLAYFGHGAFLRTGTWPQPPALTALIHGPFLLLLAADALRAFRAQGGARGGQVPDREQADEGGGREGSGAGQAGDRHHQ